jgi:3-hydroxyisobutyrate dehydrogenase-like beta-hydroxyacid dehydrogenase
MATPTDPKQWRVGLVGYGEVGRILAEDLHALGVGKLAAFDLKLAAGGGAGVSTDAAAAAHMRTHAKQHGVKLADSHRALADDCDLIVSAVTANQAVAVAQACAPAVKFGAWFLDLNSASPSAKKRAAGFIDDAGGVYVEAAAMTSIGPYRIGVPLLLGGTRANELRPKLTMLGFDAKAVSRKLGVASATKMCRSVMIKGLEALVIESFTAARAYGVEDQVLASLKETFPGVDWEQQGAYFFQRAIQHGRRRAEEMREVAATVRDIGLDPLCASATAERQAWVADQADAGLFGDKAGKQFAKSADWRPEADRILNKFRSRA